MENKVIDLSGLPCPAPVLETRKALADNGTSSIQVIVDNAASCENVERAARNLGCEVDVRPRGEGRFELYIRKTGEFLCPEEKDESVGLLDEPESEPITVLLTSERLGTGEELLGALLMKSFLKTLKDVTPRPTHLVFLNSAVKLTTGDSELVPDIQVLVEAGVTVLSCGTCLDYYNLKERLRVGAVTNMFDIVTLLVASAKTICV
jgi:selenium metabolism protein YedF